MNHRGGPILLVLSRQKLPTLDRTEFASASGLARGAYVLAETAGKTPDLILIATGSEISLAVGSKAELEKRGRAVRLVSMPSFELFEAQDRSYQDSVLPPGIRKRLAIEAAAPLSWYRWVGLDGDVVGMTTFGTSAPYQDAMRHFGFTVEKVVERAMKLIG
jgi:transketolase